MTETPEPYLYKCPELKEFGALLEDADPDFELTEMGGGYQLDVFRVYWRNSDVEIGSLRCSPDRWHIVRFDLPDDTPSPSPLVVTEDEDGDSWSAPGWETRQGFVDSLQLYPIPRKGERWQQRMTEKNMRSPKQPITREDPTDSPPTPRKGERWESRLQQQSCRVMCDPVEGYVMARFKGSVPFLVHIKEWHQKFARKS